MFDVNDFYEETDYFVADSQEEWNAAVDYIIDRFPPSVSHNESRDTWYHYYAPDNCLVFECGKMYWGGICNRGSSAAVHRCYEIFSQFSTVDADGFASLL